MNTGIPQQVQAQADKADELLKASQVESPAAKVADPNSPESHNAKPSDGVKPEETVEYWKQRFEVLQGKYNSEIAPLKDDVNLLNNLKNQVRTLTTRNQQLQAAVDENNRLITDLQQRLTEKPAETGPEMELSEEDKEYLRDEGFEDRFIEIMKKMVLARGKGKPVAAEPAKVAEPAQPAPTKVDPAVLAFWQQFTNAVPDWEQINGNVGKGIPIMPEFDNWLYGQIPYTNQTRRDALTAAQNANDATTVIKIFQDFKSEHPAIFGEKKPEIVIDPAKQVEPASSVVHTEDGQGKQPHGTIYTRQEVNEFYKDYAQKMADPRTLPSVKEEMAKKDADIVKASREGRIQG